MIFELINKLFIDKIRVFIDHHVLAESTITQTILTALFIYLFSCFSIHSLWSHFSQSFPTSPFFDKRKKHLATRYPWKSETWETEYLLVSLWKIPSPVPPLYKRKEINTFLLYASNWKKVYFCLVMDRCQTCLMNTENFIKWSHQTSIWSILLRTHTLKKRIDLHSLWSKHNAKLWKIHSDLTYFPCLYFILFSIRFWVTN